MIVGEHEPLPSNQAAGAQQGQMPDQPEDDKDIVKKVNDLLSRAKKFRKRYDSDWHSNYEFVVNGKQWPLERPRWRFNECVNIAWSTIMTEIAIQTDARPKFEFLDQEPGDQSFVKILEEINSSNWEKYHWSQVVAAALFDCKLYHVAHSIVEWNDQMEFGLGDVDYRPLDPFYCYWDPLATDVNQGKRARWFIYAEPVPTSQLKIDYPDVKDKIKPDVNGINQKKDWSSGPNTVYINFDPYSPSRLPSSAAGSGELYGGEPMTVLLRCWLRDDTMEELCEEKAEVDPSTGEPKKEYLLKKKYPKGRYIEVANNTKLFEAGFGCWVKDEWVEYEDDSIPVARLVNYSYAREYAGENEVTHLKGPQKIINYVWSYILDMFRVQANPVTIVADSGNVDEETITNEPGNIIRTADINAVQRLPGTPITGGSFDLLSTAEGLLDKIQGLQDVARGVEVPSIGSQIMLEGYLEASQTRPRMKNRNLDFYLQDCGSLVLKRMLQFYKQPRVFRMTNMEGYPQFIEFWVPDVEVVQSDGTTKTVKVAKMRTISTTEDGQAIPQSEAQVEVKGLPDVRVRSGSNLPYAKAQKQNNALQYFNAGLIDQEEALKTVDWPNYEQVMKRMQEVATQNAQAQAEAQASGAPSK